MGACWRASRCCTSTAGTPCESLLSTHSLSHHHLPALLPVNVSPRLELSCSGCTTTPGRPSSLPSSRGNGASPSCWMRRRTGHTSGSWCPSATTSPPTPSSQRPSQEGACALAAFGVLWALQHRRGRPKTLACVFIIKTRLWWYCWQCDAGGGHGGAPDSRGCARAAGDHHAGGERLHDDAEGRGGGAGPTGRPPAPAHHHRSLSRRPDAG
jgi:hypothetical protein